MYISQKEKMHTFYVLNKLHMYKSPDIEVTN